MTREITLSNRLEKKLFHEVDGNINPVSTEMKVSEKFTDTFNDECDLIVQEVILYFFTLIEETPFEHLFKEKETFYYNEVKFTVSFEQLKNDKYVALFDVVI